MATLKSKLVRLVVLFGLTGAGAWGFYLTGKPIHGVRFAEKIPLDIAGWEGVGLSVSEEEMRLLGTRDVLFRAYTRKGEPPVYLCVVFAENNRAIIHPPEVCYTASGWEVGDKYFFESKPLPTRGVFGITQILITQNYDKQLVHYWFKAGEKYTSSVYQHQWNMILNQLLFRQSTGALIRLSTGIQEGEERGAAQKRLDKFTEAVVPFITRYLP